MLQFDGPARQTHCDGIPRRSFLLAGALGFGGLSMGDLFRAEAAAGIRGSHRAIINIHLDGGPPQMDMIDMKPQAPREVRGEFDSMATSIPGFRVNELMPRTAKAAQELTFLRSSVQKVVMTHFNANPDLGRRILSRLVVVLPWVVSSTI